MKNLFLLIGFFCFSTMHAQNFPVGVKMKFHFILDDNAEGENLRPVAHESESYNDFYFPSAAEFSSQVISELNDLLSNNQESWLKVEGYNYEVKDIPYRVFFTGINYISCTEDYNKEFNESLYGDDFEGKFKFIRDDVIDVFFLPKQSYVKLGGANHYDNTISVTGAMNWYSKNGANGIAKLLSHELAHNWIQPHPFEGDNFDDTVDDHPNCWSLGDDRKSESCTQDVLSNNVLDYNNQQNSFTPMQIEYIKNEISKEWSTEKIYVDHNYHDKYTPIELASAHAYQENIVINLFDKKVYHQFELSLKFKLSGSSAAEYDLGSIGWWNPSQPNQLDLDGLILNDHYNILPGSYELRVDFGWEQTIIPFEVFASDIGSPVIVPSTVNTGQDNLFYGNSIQIRNIYLKNATHVNYTDKVRIYNLANHQQVLLKPNTGKQILIKPSNQILICNNPIDPDLISYRKADSNTKSFDNDEADFLSANIYPNPFTDQLNVDVSAVEVEVFNLMGNKVYTGAPGVINLANEAEGMYIVKWEENGEVKTEKVILAK